MYQQRKKITLSLLLFSALLAIIIIKISHKKSEDLYITSKNWTKTKGIITSCANTCKGGIRGCAKEAVEIQYSWLNDQSVPQITFETIVEQQCSNWPAGKSIDLRSGNDAFGSASAISEINWLKLQKSN